MIPRYLPKMISLIDSGALKSRVSVRLRRSSLMSRMVSKGITSNSTIALLPSCLPTTSSVTPGLLRIVKSCGCSCK